MLRVHVYLFHGFSRGVNQSDFLRMIKVPIWMNDIPFGYCTGVLQVRGSVLEELQKEETHFIPYVFQWVTYFLFFSRSQRDKRALFESLSCFSGSHGVRNLAMGGFKDAAMFSIGNRC